MLPFQGDLQRQKKKKKLMGWLGGVGGGGGVFAINYNIPMAVCEMISST